MADRCERWGIVGGGMLGMTLALRLAQAGRQVTVFEAADAVGGLAGAWQLGDVVWDRHYHVILASDTLLRSLLAELGLEQEIRWVPTKTGFYVDGTLHSMSNVWDFLRFPALNLVDKVRLGAAIFYASRIQNWRRLESVSAVDWLRQLCGPRAVNRLWLPLLRAKLGENYDKASAAFIWAIIARMYAARRSGLKQEMFGYVEGGYARILDRFLSVLDAAGVCVKAGYRVHRVRAEGAGVGVRFEHGEEAHFDRVVMTLPGPLAGRICPDLNADEQARLNGIQYQGVICASVLLKRAAADYYITNITDAWVPFTAVIEMSALVDRAQFKGHHLVYLPKYVRPDDPAFELSDTELEARFVPALIKMYPHLRQDDVEMFCVSRARHVLALSTLNYSQNLPPMQTSVPGVFLVNSAQIVNGTLNVNETVRLANRAVETILNTDVKTNAGLCSQVA